jgi:tricorn protease
MGDPVQRDVYAALLTEDAYQRWVGAETPAAPTVTEWVPDFSGQPHRTVRLTPSPLPLLAVAPSGSPNQLIAFINTPLAGIAGLTLNTRTGAITPAPAPPAGATSLAIDPADPAVHFLTHDSIHRVGIADGKSSSVPFAAEANYNLRGEMAYIFDHVVRFTEVKFYDTKMHGVDWRKYAARYREFLPSISRWQDFGDLLGELVGELNASHTAGHYSHPVDYGDATASLGIYFDDSHRDAGMKIARVLAAGPADRPAGALSPGAVILAVNGQEITPEMGIDSLLNHQAGRRVRLTVHPASGDEPKEEIVTPVDLPTIFKLAYEQWVSQRKDLTRELSKGRIGYVHVPAMNSPSFERASSEMFGEYAEAEAIIVDVRFNLGGNLHDQLITMLTGERAGRLISNKGVVVAHVPEGRWGRPNAVMANAASYSDGSVFPHFYKANKIGPLIGERVPGTGTAVWWETQLEPNLVYGVPEVGFRDLRTDKWLENTEVVPDVLIYNTPEGIANGRDEQLEAAVRTLLESLSK